MNSVSIQRKHNEWEQTHRNGCDFECKAIYQSYMNIEQVTIFDSDFIWESLLEQIKGSKNENEKKNQFHKRTRVEKKRLYEAKMKMELMEEGKALKNAIHIGRALEYMEFIFLFERSTHNSNMKHIAWTPISFFSLLPPIYLFHFQCFRFRLQNARSYILYVCGFTALDSVIFGLCILQFTHDVFIFKIEI